MGLELRFDEAEHRYFCGAMELPSVTTVLGLITDFSKVPRDVLEVARIRGVAVHKATEFDDAGELDESTVHHVIRPYLDAWRKFRHETKFAPDQLEARVMSLNHLYAGTLDRIGFMQGRTVLLDIKARSSMTEEIGPQLAAYARAWLEMTGEDLMNERYSVQLKPDGTYRLHHYDNTDDFGAFLGCLAIYNWRRQ